MPIPQKTKQHPGFSLIELLTCIAVIAILFAILMPVIKNVRHSAHNAECSSNLRQLGQASMSYVLENNAALPQLDYQYVRVLFPYIYPERADDIPQVQGGQPFPDGLKNTVFYCPAMDDSVVNSRGYAINDRIARLQYIQTPDGGTEPNKESLPVTLVEDTSKIALFSDTYTTSNMSNVMWQAQAKVLDRHGHLNVVFLDGHVESVQPDEPRVLDTDGPFWVGKTE